MLPDRYSAFAADSLIWPKALQPTAEAFLAGASARAGISNDPTDDLLEGVPRPRLGTIVRPRHARRDPPDLPLEPERLERSEPHDDGGPNERPLTPRSSSDARLPAARSSCGTGVELYETPAYFPELLTEAPCVLVGGRGTGKTAVLAAYSYHGQQKLHGDRPIRDMALLRRVPTNQHRSCRGVRRARARGRGLAACVYSLRQPNAVREHPLRSSTGTRRAPA